jgi:hypothetical protein
MRVLSMTTEQLNLLPPADRATYIQIVSYCISHPIPFVPYWFRGSLIVISFLNRQRTTLGVPMT